LIKNIKKDNILFIDFEHERLRNLDANNLEEMLQTFYELFKPNKNKPIYLFLDEIQNVKDWYKWIRGIHNLGKFRICFWFII
jgi:hypothetical protein